MRRIWKKYFKDLYNVEEVGIHMCDYDGVRRGNYFGVETILDWIRKLCNMAFESGDVSEDLRSAVIVPLYKGKGKMIKCENYRGISLLSVVGKIYTDILVDSL